MGNLQELCQIAPLFVFSLRISGTESIVNPFDCHSRSKPPITPRLCVLSSGLQGISIAVMLLLAVLAYSKSGSSVIGCSVVPLGRIAFPFSSGWNTRFITGLPLSSFSSVIQPENTFPSGAETIGQIICVLSAS